jgi:DNA-binding protein H-NS
MRKPNIDKLSYNELVELSERVQEAIDQRKADEKAALRQQMKELAAEAGFDLEDVVAKGRARQKRSKVAPKYRNPNDPTQTWSGRGRQPNWLVAEIKKGKTPEDFQINWASIWHSDYGADLLQIAETRKARTAFRYPTLYTRPSRRALGLRVFDHHAIRVHAIRVIAILFSGSLLDTPNDW